MMHRGYSLVELSIVLVIIGMVTMLGVRLLPGVGTQEDRHQFDADVATVNEAVIGFSMVYGRLPCPDTTGDGLENCAPLNVGGTVPYATLSLPAPVKDASRFKLRYAVYQNANAAITIDPALLQLSNRQPLDTDISQVVQRYVPLLPANDANGSAIIVTPYNNMNGLDLCFGLRKAAVSATNTVFVHSDSGATLNVAYALASSGSFDADGDGNLFDGRNTLGMNLFDSPDRRISNFYDDRVYAMSSEVLLGRLFCSQSLSALHAQANVAITALRSVVALQDTKTLADIALQKANADVAAAVAANLGAAAAISLAAAEAFTATAEAITTLGAMVWTVPLASAAMVAAIAAQVLAIAVAVLTGFIVADANASVAGAIALVNQSKTLAGTILGHVSTADQAGVYGW
ncbi:MAG: type II secretion system protein [Mariprofundaceae bacterium]